MINPLGQPIDGRGDIDTDERRALELQAPSVVQRQGVKSRCRPASRPSIRRPRSVAASVS